MTNVSTERLASDLLKNFAGLPLVAGDIFYAVDAVTIARLAKGTVGQVLTMNLTGTAPEWATGASIVEGTFTPSISFGNAAVGMTYSTQTGDYKKIGNLVVAAGRVTLSAKGSSVGIARIEGLPFAGMATRTFPFSVYCAAMTGLTGKVSASTTSTNEAILYQSAATGDLVLQNTAFTATSDIRFCATYFTA